ncbi:MAG: FG-GAP repeat domain-containing protein, partial [Limisphaerales bacterium]
DETSLTPNALATGDLNGDGKTDLLLLSENHIHVLYQNSGNTLGEPERIPYVGTVKSIQVLDINGDGLDDLLLVNWDDPNPFRFRLQTPDGQLGPEYHFPVPSIRSYWADDLDGDSKTELMSISQNSGRAQISNFTLKDAEPLSGSFMQGQFQIFPLNKTGKTRRGMTWADLNGDGLPDLLVAEPDSGQMTLHLQKPDGALVTTNTFSTFSGISDVRVLDWNKDGKPEIFVLSPDERQIGITRLDDKGRIPFPQILRLEGRPLAMTVGTIDPQQSPMLAVISEVETNRFLVTRTAEGNFKSQKLSDSFKATPASINIHDVDQDGLPDLVVLIPYEKIKILRQVPGEDFEEHDVIPPGGNADQPWLSTADVDGDGKNELLLAQRNFLRAVVLESNTETSGTNTNKVTWSFSVKEQINGASSNSRIVAATPVQKSGTNSVSLFLLDAERKVLTLSERDEAGVWQVVRNLPLPATDYRMLQGINMGSSEVNSVAFLGVNSVAWMNLSGRVWGLTELDYYETPIKGARLHDVISGDLNNNGRKDLVFLETAKNYVDLVTFEPPHKMVPANRWPVFEERTFRSRRTDLAEPREALIADVTGDGRNDLIVLVHDRVLVYVQD